MTKTFEITSNIPRRCEDQDFEAGDTIAVIHSDVSVGTLAQMLRSQSVTAVVIDAPNAPVVDNESEADEEVGEADGDTDETIDMPEQSVGGEPVDDDTVAVNFLVASGLAEAIAKRVVQNARALEEPKLLTREGIRGLVAEGFDLDDDLDNIGPKYAKILAEWLEDQPAE